MRPAATTGAAPTRDAGNAISSPLEAGVGPAPRAPRSEPTVPRPLIGPILAFARVANPLVLRLAGRRYAPIAVVRHAGRRSGRRYATPVVAFPTHGGFVISLPYGSGVSWCRNVLAGARRPWGGGHGAGRRRRGAAAPDRPTAHPAGGPTAAVPASRRRRRVRLSAVVADSISPPARPRAAAGSR
jgi:hypothetical protein